MPGKHARKVAGICENCGEPVTYDQPLYAESYFKDGVRVDRYIHGFGTTCSESREALKHRKNP